MSPARRGRPRLPFSPPLRPPTPAEAAAFLRQEADGAGARAYLAQRALEVLHHAAGLLQRAGGELERALQAPPKPKRRPAARGRVPRVKQGG